MPSPGWVRLRPCDRDLRTIVKFVVLGVCGLLIAAGLWSVINFWRLEKARDAVNFTIFLYVIVFGLLLALGELGWPRGLFDYFGFLESSSGRAWFLFFTSTLAISSGLSGDRSRISSILLTIAGILGVIITFFALCYGGDRIVGDATNYGGAGSSAGRGAGASTSDGNSTGTGRRGGVAGYFGGGKDNQHSRYGPENVIWIYKYKQHSERFHRLHGHVKLILVVKAIEGFSNCRLQIICLGNYTYKYIIICFAIVAFEA